MSYEIKPVSIIHDNELKKYLHNYYLFLDRFSHSNVTISIKANDDIVYYQGKYFLESAHKYKSELFHSKYHIDDFTYLNEYSFVIRMDNMKIKYAINNFNTPFEYVIPEDQLNQFIINYKQKIPKLFRNLFAINTDSYKIDVFFLNNWYEYSFN